MTTLATGIQPVEESRDKGLKSGALGLVSSVVIGVASTAATTKNNVAAKL